MTTIGDVLDEFFHPFSTEKLWVMPQNDNYTQRVRQWGPVKNSVNRTKANLTANCSTWQTAYKTQSSWKPTKTNAVKAGAYRDFVPHPPGTAPKDCIPGFILYVESKAAKAIPFPLNPAAPLMPTIQIDSLYTASIGSFNIYTTVDAIDCTKKTATLNYWMYNAMSKKSFGKYASNPVFALCGMKTQYMWWNWTEQVSWSTGSVTTVTPTASAGW